VSKATAAAHPNIAFIKYWGKRNLGLNLPANPSLSMNLAAMTTVTTVEFHAGLETDLVEWDGRPAVGQARDRVVAHLDRVRALAGIAVRARVSSRNDFPAGVGLASSASAFAALSLAASAAAGLDLGQAALSRLARLGSGSASRSIPAGFSLWDGESDEASLARQVAPPEHWDLHDVVAVPSRQHKDVGSHDGHALAPTSPLHQARLAAVPALLEAVRSGIEQRNLDALGPAIETDALLMHGVMMTSLPSLLYWEPATLSVLHAVRAWRRKGLGVYFTMDAGPSVHCICAAGDAREVADRLAALTGVLDVLSSGPGGGARLVDRHLF
jgi:diphosphomevalonate decarboxylase